MDSCLLVGTFRDDAFSTVYHCHNAAAWCTYVKMNSLGQHTTQRHPFPFLLYCISEMGCTEKIALVVNVVRCHCFIPLPDLTTKLNQSKWTKMCNDLV